MSLSNPEQLKMVRVRALGLRLLLIAVVALVFFLSWRAARWYTGNEIALVAQRMENSLETARSAVRLAPRDPMAYWSLAGVEGRDVAVEQLKASVRDYEQAVSLSPHDFRLWVDLGRAREHAGDAAGSEKAFRRAIELAPHYVWPRWHLGNLLLREGRYDEAFAELRQVAEADPSKRGAVLDLAWYAYRGDVEAIRRAMGGSAIVRAELINYLLNRQRADDAVRVWSSLNADEMKEQRSTGQALVKYLVNEKKVRAALAVSRALGAEGGAALAEVGKVSNGDFEGPVAQKDAGAFDWQVTSVQQAQVALDAIGAHGGRVSLRVNFNATSALAFDNIKQLIAVEPATSYRLSFFIRTNDLKSAAEPIVQILSVTDGKVIAVSPLSPTGKSDWQQVVMDFKTPQNADGIMLRITRADCNAEGGVCPIFGTVWYDDFNLQPVGGNAPPQTGRRSS